MKQHITVEQLNELNEKGKGKLREYWLKDDRSDFFEGTINVIHPNYNFPMSLADIADRSGWYTDNGCYPLLSIGQMIEFLDEYMKKDKWRESLCFDSGEHQWHVYGISFDPQNDKFGSRKAKVSPELCDALWEACKEVLNKDTP